MNLLIVSDYAAPYEGNFICSIKALCKEVNNDEGKIFFLFASKAKNIPWVIEFSKLHSVEFWDSNKKNWIKQLISIIREKKVQLIYTHFCLLKTQIITKTGAKITKKMLVQHWHNHYQQCPGIKGVLVKWAFNGDLNIGCSKSVADTLPYEFKKVEYVDNAIDYTRLDNYDTQFEFFEDKKGITILMFGFDYYRKGVDIAIQALKQIKDTYGIRLVISLSINHDKIRNLIEESNGDIFDWVKIVNARNDVATYYHASDIFLSASREEGFSYALLESVYCGCIPISSRIGGPPYESIPYCYTFGNEDYKELQEKIIEAIDEYSMAQNQKKIERREAVIKKYDLNVWAASVYNKLSEAIKNKK